jgi:hypothetical protein
LGDGELESLREKAFDFVRGLDGVSDLYWLEGLVYERGGGYGVGVKVTICGIDVVVGNGVFCFEEFVGNIMCVLSQEIASHFLDGEGFVWDGWQGAAFQVGLELPGEAGFL